ncbi:MAG TPA: sulfatase-like hydrolase/transferase, partial [Candidatus Sulfomarinibacteraceae bacterium]|nr:sulfatase-like hydrolase/transferase [Candidatus Sulfomarinibacteraceae bacterium]
RLVDQIAPSFRDDRQARNTRRRWNREAYRWAAPLADPLEPLEQRVLSDMYDAEVAYQDDYLGSLFDALAQRTRAEDTLSLVVADHGDGLGEHGYMGHAFVAYQELIHVPLIAHWPRRLPAGTRVTTPVSTRRVFHTALDAAGELPETLPAASARQAQALTLVDTIYGRDAENGVAFAEVYPPLNFVRAIEHRQPHLLEQFGCLSLRRALLRDELKLIEVDGESRELFDLDRDPLELDNVLSQRLPDAAELERQMAQLAEHVERQRDNTTAGAPLGEQMDKRLLQQLRGLGYIE